MEHSFTGQFLAPILEKGRAGMRSVRPSVAAAAQRRATTTTQGRDGHEGHRQEGDRRQEGTTATKTATKAAATARATSAPAQTRLTGSWSRAVHRAEICCRAANYLPRTMSRATRGGE